MYYNTGAITTIFEAQLHIIIYQFGLLDHFQHFFGIKDIHDIGTHIFKNNVKPRSSTFEIVILNQKGPSHDVFSGDKTFSNKFFRVCLPTCDIRGCNGQSHWVIWSEFTGCWSKGRDWSICQDSTTCEMFKYQDFCEQSRRLASIVYHAQLPTPCRSWLSRQSLSAGFEQILRPQMRHGHN